MINNYTFSHPCFIRNSTRDLWDKLHRLGGRYGDFLWEDNNHRTILVADKCYYRCYDKSQIDNLIASGYIDCGTNEDLFLAIAALSEDTDKNQWFVAPKIKTIRLPGCFGQTIGMDGHQQIIDGYEWHLSDEDGISEKIRSYVENGEDEKFLPHKATVEELIKYFN